MGLRDTPVRVHLLRQPLIPRRLAFVTASFLGPFLVHLFLHRQMKPTQTTTAARVGGMTLGCPCLPGPRNFHQSCLLHMFNSLRSSGSLGNPLRNCAETARTMPFCLALHSVRDGCDALHAHFRANGRTRCCIDLRPAPCDFLGVDAEVCHESHGSWLVQLNFLPAADQFA